MKKIFFIIGLLIIFGNYNFNINAMTSEKEDVLYNNIEEPNDVEVFSKGVLLENNDHLLYKNNKTQIRIEGKLICCYEFETVPYIVYQKLDNILLCKIIDNNYFEVELNADWKINHIIVKENTIYMFGCINNFSIIVEYTKNLEYVEHHLFFENTNIDFYDAVFHDNKWYIFGMKEGHCKSNEVENIGNYTDKKTIMVLMDNNFNVMTIKYYNHNNVYEKARFVDIYNNYIYYYFEVENLKYLYKSDINLDEHYLVNVCDHQEILLDVNGDYLLFTNDNTLIMDSIKESLDLGTYNKIYKFVIKDSKLEIYHYNRNNLYVKKISEYHIDKLDPIVISYENGNVDFNKNLNLTNEIEIKSYFSEVEVLCNTEFSKNVCGKYNIELLITRPNLENIKLSSEVNILPYVNVSNGGSYCTGFSLKFLGNATLNGIKINSGHNIIEEGEYKLEISDNLGNTTVYNFLIIDNYYIRTEEFKNFDIVGELNSITEVTLKFKNVDVVEIYVNDELTEFKQSGDYLTLYLDGNDDYGINRYIINKIITLENEYIENFGILVNILKPIPSINILENNDEIPNFTINVEDSAQTIKYLEVVTMNENINKVYRYYFGSQFIMDNYDFNNGTIEVFICYDLGDGVIRKDSVMKLEGAYKTLSNLIVFSSLIETEQLKQINIKINSDNINKMNNLIVNNQSILQKYNVKKDYTNLIISSGLTFIIVLFVVVYLIFKKRRTKKA